MGAANLKTFSRTYQNIVFFQQDRKDFLDDGNSSSSKKKKKKNPPNLICLKTKTSIQQIIR